MAKTLQERIDEALERYRQSREPRDAVAAATEINKLPPAGLSDKLKEALARFASQPGVVVGDKQRNETAALGVVQVYVNERAESYTDLNEFLNPKKE